ncbi:MAG: hypothetical protein H7Y09_06750 [Chitinophagaceae bacterium]|nr:hypothetical protein [Anaerolineae bacterium]
MIDRIQQRLLWVSLGILILLILDRANKDEAAHLAPKLHAVGEKSPSANKPSAPKTASEPDDFTRLEGIGPKVREALIASTITTFQQMAAMSAEELYRIVHDEHNVRIVGDATKTWPKQAQFLVDGDLDGLKAYQDQLIGGREPQN